MPEQPPPVIVAPEPGSAVAVVESPAAPAPAEPAAPVEVRPMSLPQKIVSKWYWIVLVLVAVALVGALLERMTGVFTVAIPGFGRLWQGAQASSPTPPAGQ